MFFLLLTPVGHFIRWAKTIKPWISQKPTERFAKKYKNRNFGYIFLNRGSMFPQNVFFVWRQLICNISKIFPPQICSPCPLKLALEIISPLSSFLYLIPSLFFFFFFYSFLLPSSSSSSSSTSSGLADCAKRLNDDFEYENMGILRIRKSKK